MKFISQTVASLILMSAPVFVFAQGAAQNAAVEAASFVDKLNQIIIFPLIALLSAVAFLVFLWGCAQYLIGATNEQARQQGVKHITFGIIGLVVMLSAFAILRIATSTFGLSDQLECANNPNLGGCQDVFGVPDTSGGGGNTGDTTTGGGASTGGGTTGGGASTGGGTTGGGPAFEERGRDR